MCTLGRIVNIIKKSELDRLSTSWAMVWALCLLCWCGTAAPGSGDTSSASANEGATASGAALDSKIDEPFFMKESVKLGPFQTHIIKCKSNFGQQAIGIPIWGVVVVDNGGTGIPAGNPKLIP